jgi:hypothetical protein
MVTLMLVTGSVQVEIEALLELLDEVVVQVMAVLAGAAPQEFRPRSAATASNSRKRFTAPRPSLPEFHAARCSTATPNPQN